MKRILSFLLLITSFAFGQSATQPQRLLYGTKAEVRSYPSLAGVFWVPNFATRRIEAFIKDASDSTSPESDSVIVSTSGVRFKRLAGYPSGGGASTAWDSITGKPSTFAPSTHTHIISSLTGYAAAMAAKQDTLPTGTIFQYFRGNKTLATLNGAAVGLPFVKNVDQTIANNLTSGTIPSGRYGARTIPIASLDTAGAVSGNVVKYNGTAWVSGTVPSPPRFYYTPTDYGVDTTGVANALTGLKAMFDAVKLTGGVVIMPTGRYRVNGTLVIEGSGNENIRTLIQGYGARFITNNADTIAMVVFNDHMHTTVSGLRFDGAVDYDGWYFGNTTDCQFKLTRFGHRNTGAQDETYWSHWTKCSWRDAVDIKVGSPSVAHEFNSNTFTSCQLWSGAYAIRIYGTHTIQSFNLEWCDISYQTGSNPRIYIDADMTYPGTVNIIGGYFDDAKNLPFNTKNIFFNTHFSPNNPGDSNLGSFTLKTGSGVTTSTDFGSRTAPRRAMSVYNLLTNGDIRYGLQNITSSWDTTTIVSGAGYFGKYLHLGTNSGTQRYAEWSMGIPAPFPGWYNITIIGRNLNTAQVLVGNVVQNVEVLYTNTQNTMADTAFVVTSGKVYLQQGQTYKLRVFSQISVTNRVDIAYIGLTYGLEGHLGAIEHPSTSFSVADNTTNLFANGDGTVLSPNITTSYGAAVIYTSSGEDQTGDGTVIRYNPLTAGDFPEIRFNLNAKDLKAAKAAGYVTLTMKVKVVSGYGASYWEFGAGAVYVVPGTTTAGAWQDWRVTYAVPSGATQVSFRVAMAGAGTAKDIYFDGISLTLGKTSSAWAPSPRDLKLESLVVAFSDETTAITTGAAKVTFRMPYAMTVTGVRLNVNTAQSSGSVFTVDINEGGTSIISTKLTLDNTEKTSTTAATAAVISDAELADDAEITVDVDQSAGTAKGGKITITGYKR